MDDLHRTFGGKLKKLSELLVLYGITDVQELCQAHTLFQEISELGRKKLLFDWVAIADAAAQLIQDIVLCDAKNPKAAMKTVCDIVTAMQFACESRSLEHVLFEEGGSVHEGVRKQGLPEAQKTEMDIFNLNKANSRSLKLLATDIVSNMFDEIAQEVGQYAKSCLRKIPEDA